MSASESAPARPLTLAAVYRSTVDIVCFVALIAVMGIVIYALFRRATFETSYYAATLVAVLGALLLLVSLAQQNIAARDAETWRTLADWHVRAGERGPPGFDDKDEGTPAPADVSPPGDRENMVKAIASRIKDEDEKDAKP